MRRPAFAAAVSSLWCGGRRGLVRPLRASSSFEAWGAKTKELPYEGVVTDLRNTDIDDATFAKALDETLATHEKKNSAWLRLPLANARLAELASKRGFRIHHAPPGGQSFTMYKWLRPSDDKVPPYAPATQVGCAGFLVNKRNELLVIKEWRRDSSGERVPAPIWKLPGGLADAGESFLDCAARETTEETGVRCRPVSLLGLWHRHNVAPFNKSDVYAVVRLEALDEDSLSFDLCPDEISDAKWYKLDDFLEKEDHPLIRKIIKELYAGGRGGPSAEMVDLGVQFKGRERYATYFPRSTAPLLGTGITAVASDVDGTLLRSDSTLHPANLAALKELSQATSGLHFFVATGKCRAGARNSLEDAFGSHSLVRGVFSNGLVVYGESGEVVFERSLDRDVVDAVLRHLSPDIFDVVAYCRDDLVSHGDASRPRVVELADRYREPRPTRHLGPGDFAELPNLNKLLLLADPADIRDARPGIEHELRGLASVTTALPSMLEILPLGASKRVGVQAYCRHIGCDEATQLLAVGDGENDLDMIKHAAVGVAMANAVPEVKSVADVLVDSNDKAGAARAFSLARTLSASFSSSAADS